MATKMGNKYKAIYNDYPNGDKASVVLDALSDTDKLSWEDIFWCSKYLIIHKKYQETTDIISAMLVAFDKGLQYNENAMCFAEAKVLLADLYIENKQYESAFLCLLTLLEKTEKVPPETYLKLVYAEMHTNSLAQILKSPTLFVNDLGKSGKKYAEKQREVFQELLRLATTYLQEQEKCQVDFATIEKAVVFYELDSSQEWKAFSTAITALSAQKKKVTKAPEKQESKASTTPKVIAKKAPEPSIKASSRKKTSTTAPAAEPQILTTLAEAIKKATGVVSKNKPHKITHKVPSTAANSKPVDIAHTEIIPTEMHQSATQSSDMKALLDMMAGIQKMVVANSEQLTTLRADLDNAKANSVDAAAIEARLKAGEDENSALQTQLNEMKKKLAESEAERSSMEETIARQGAELENRKKLEFSEDEQRLLSAYKAIYIFDTCAIMHRTDLLEFIGDDEIVRVPKVVLEELNKHKSNRYDSEIAKNGQRAIKAIRVYKTSIRFDYEDSHPELISADYEDSNDNRILSCAMRYELYTTLPVYIITDDYDLLNKATSEHIDAITAQEFISQKIQEAEEARRRQQEDIVADETDEDNTSEEDNEEQKKQAILAFLQSKIATKHGMTQAEVDVLRNNGITKYGEFINLSEDELASYKAKNGLAFTAHFLVVQKKIRNYLEEIK